MFDLPVTSRDARRQYTPFRHALLPSCLRWTSGRKSRNTLPRRAGILSTTTARIPIITGGCKQGRLQKQRVSHPLPWPSFLFARAHAQRTGPLSQGYRRPGSTAGPVDRPEPDDSRMLERRGGEFLRRRLHPREKQRKQSLGPYSTTTLLAARAFRDEIGLTGNQKRQRIFRESFRKSREICVDFLGPLTILVRK